MKRIKLRKFIAIVLNLIIFIPLTYMKFFTAQITIVGDTTTSIVETEKVQILNNIYLINKIDSKVAYSQVFHADEIGNTSEIIYKLLISLWWLLVSIYSLLIISKFIKFIYYKRKNSYYKYIS